MSFIGASALHLAIAYSNNDLVTKLLIAGAKMDERAIGKYKIIIWRTPSLSKLTTIIFNTG